MLKENNNMNGQQTHEKKSNFDLSSHEDNMNETQRDGTAHLLEFLQKKSGNIKGWRTRQAADTRVRWDEPSGKELGSSLFKSIIVQRPHHPAPLHSIYPREITSYVHTKAGTTSLLQIYLN